MFNFLWPSADMEFKEIKNEENKVTIKWTHNYFEDYKKLSYDYYDCGYNIFNEVISSGHDNIKSDMWFLTGIFLLRQSIELGLKALICRICKRNIDIQIIFELCCHDLSLLFTKYLEFSDESFLTIPEKDWLEKYLISLEIVDKNSDMFRFPFEDDFLAQYRDKFLNNIEVANNILQAFALVKKSIELGNITKEDEFDESLKPHFFVFTTHGIGNCYLWQSITDDGFHVKVKGYIDVIDYIHKNTNISIETKLYPLLFMFRNTIELCLKRLFYSKVDNGVPLNVFRAKRRSHLIKKDLWKNVKPIITNYANQQGNDMDVINIIDHQLDVISSLDKNGDNFRYPTSYSLEYRIDNVELDIENIYEYLKAIVNFLDCCDDMLKSIYEYQAEMRAEYEAEMRAEYEAEMRADMDWY
ncbi:MAG: hypothetical protein J6K17_02435 [Oscillospiraceae bacterium]|nr:hypothetical protein [Oscillospiraceae bacterium]